jgi:hypothetical protein
VYTVVAVVGKYLQETFSREFGFGKGKMNDEKIKIRLKIREEDREIEVSVRDTMEVIKMREFPHERIRIIYHGRELYDHETFESHGITNHHVLHIMIQSRTNSDAPITNLVPSHEGLDSLDLLLLTLMVFFSLGWMMAYSIPELFTTSSLSMLSLLSLAMAIALFFRFR